MDDALVYHQAIISELVHLVREWLSSILESMDLYAALNLPVPHPGYPLPKGFPFNDCLTETFHWKHIYGQDEIAHGYRVLFKFRGVLAQQWSPLVWTITSGNSLSPMMLTLSYLFSQAHTTTSALSK